MKKLEEKVDAILEGTTKYTKGAKKASKVLNTFLKNKTIKRVSTGRYDFRFECDDGTVISLDAKADASDKKGGEDMFYDITKE